MKRTPILLFVALPPPLNASWKSRIGFKQLITMHSWGLHTKTTHSQCCLTELIRKKILYMIFSTIGGQRIVVMKIFMPTKKYFTCWLNITSRYLKIFFLGGRMTTSMIYLSDVEAGGRTIFPYQNVSITPRHRIISNGIIL